MGYLRIFLQTFDISAFTWEHPCLFTHVISLIQPDERLENDVRAGRAGALSIRTWLSGKGVEFYEKIINLKCFYATDFTDLLSQ